MDVNQKVDKLIIDVCEHIQEELKIYPTVDFPQLPSLLEALAKLKSAQNWSATTYLNERRRGNLEGKPSYL